MDFALVWVCLLGLPIELWSSDVFRMIGNSLGMFVAADMSFKDFGLMVVAQILVSLYLRDGLTEKMEI